MASRSHQDWDPMQEDYDNTNYTQQYGDDDSGTLVKLDHKRLYVTNIPKGLSQAGLRAAFEKYGKLNEAYVNEVPNKRYGLVSFETAAEARLAMTKLNHTEPLKLNVNIAHESGARAPKKSTKPKERDNSMNLDRASERERDTSSYVSRERDRERKSIYQDRERDRESKYKDCEKDRDSKYRDNERDRDDLTSVCSRERNNRKEDLSFGDNITMEDLPSGLDDEMNVESLDPELLLELDQLRMQKLKLQQEQLEVRQRMLLRQAQDRKAMSATTRSVLPGGKIMLRNNSEGVPDARDPESSIVGAGDSPLQSQQCVSCGIKAESYCARCGVTPYCSVACQRRDWNERHRSVCHNLAQRRSVLDVTDGPRGEIEPTVPASVTLRRPRDRLESARSGRDHHEPSRPSRENHEPSRPSRENHEPSRPSRENHEYTRPARDNRDSARPMRNNQEPSRPMRDNQEASRPMRNNENFRPASDHRRPPRDNDQAGSDRFNNKNTDNNRGGRNGRGRNFNPRNGEMRRPACSNDSPQDSPRDTQTKPRDQNESSKPVTTQQVANKPEVKRDEPKADAVQPRSSNNNVMVNRADATPAKRRIIPMNCLIETLSVGDTFLLSVDAKTSECRVQVQGFVCLSMTAAVEADYENLCGPFSEACEKEAPYTPSPGDAFAYFNKEEEAWYRARLLAPNLAALIDSSKVIVVGTSDRCHTLPAAYQTQPEFSCVLQSEKATLEASLQATITSKTTSMSNVSLVDAATGAPIGDGTVTRWLPKVDYPASIPPAPVASQPEVKPTVLPEVSRPEVKNNGRVLLVDCTGFNATYVRSCDMDMQRAFDTILQDVVMYALKAKPLTEPPSQGTVVISKFTDGNFYRALVKRTNKNNNKYLIEYLEWGNVQVNQLENLYACPPELNIQARPVVTSLVTIGSEATAFTPAAIEYIETLKETAEMLLTTDSGLARAPSGSAVNLIVIKGNVNLNRKLQEMCTPEWKKMEERGANVLEADKIMYPELEWVTLPPGGCELDILDFSSIENGIVNGCPLDLPHAKYVLTTLTEKIGEYCNSALGREPYLPNDLELCIAQMPPYEQWFRAVKTEQNGVGGSTACVLYVDYGTIQEDVPVTMLRKMLPEFVRDLPALGVAITIKDFPEKPTQAQLAAALTYMKVDDDGRGRLTVTRCEYNDTDALYIVTAPGLIEAIRQA